MFSLVRVARHLRGSTQQENSANLAHLDSRQLAWRDFPWMVAATGLKPRQPVRALGPAATRTSHSHSNDLAQERLIAAALWLDGSRVTKAAQGVRAGRD